MKKARAYEIRKGRTDPPSTVPADVQAWGRQWSITHRADGTLKPARKEARTT